MLYLVYKKYPFFLEILGLFTGVKQSDTPRYFDGDLRKPNV